MFFSNQDRTQLSQMSCSYLPRKHSSSVHVLCRFHPAIPAAASVYGPASPALRDQQQALLEIKGQYSTSPWGGLHETRHFHRQNSFNVSALTHIRDHRSYTMGRTALISMGRSLTGSLDMFSIFVWNFFSLIQLQIFKGSPNMYLSWNPYSGDIQLIEEHEYSVHMESD